MSIYNHRKKKSANSYLKTFIFSGLVILIIVYGYYKHTISSAVDKDDTQNISFVVNKGEGAKKIIKNLKEKDLIKNETFFYLYVKNQDLSTKIAAGNFNLNRSMNGAEILQALTNPQHSEQAFTIQEGLTIAQIDEKLAKEGFGKPGDFINAANNFSDWDKYPFLSPEKQNEIPYKLEGFIYPDTYFLDTNNFEANTLIKIALENFDKKLKTIDLKNNDKDIFDIVTMASIVENEVFGKKDRKLVAGLLWKRLENDWTLGADITVIYATGNRQISYDDLQQDSPYNTRKHLGLPPGPVSNPSIESIEATVNPTPSEYWFYLTTLDTGEVIYAESNEDHNRNKSKYL